MRNRLLRSCLFAPGINIKAVDKAFGLPADVIILDLEDSVAPTSKAQARKIIASKLLEKPIEMRRKTQSVIVRINDPFTDVGRDDFEVFSNHECQIDGICIPKVEDPEKISTLSSSCMKKIWAMIETPLGVINVNRIAKMDSIDALVFGSNDLTKSLHAKHTPSREPLLYSMSRCIMAARAYDKFVIDGVHLNVSDTNGLEEACKQGKNLGFDGKSLIHPNQVDITNRIFSPSLEEVEYASRIKAAYDIAISEGNAVCVVDGKLVEYLHVLDAIRILNDWKAITGNDKP